MRYSLKKIIASFIIILGAYIAWWFFWPLSPVMIVSVSPDGHHAISSHQNRTVVLWDISKQQKKIVSRWSNIYSAYFINDDAYMYQTLLLEHVKVKRLNGKTVHSFKNFPVYGHVMSQDLQHYIASTHAWDVYLGYGQEQRMIKDSYSMDGFYSGKLFNLSLSDNGDTLLTAGIAGGADAHPLDAGYSTHEAYNNGYYPNGVYQEKSLLEGVVLWDTTTGKPLQKYPGNRAKTHATLSPDGRYVVSGDEGGSAFVWDAQTGRLLFRHYHMNFGKWIPLEERKEGEPTHIDAESLIPRPDDFKKPDGLSTSAVLSLKFIDNSDYYLRFTTYIPYAILYRIDDPKPLAYFPLGNDPRPSVDEYVRNASIDTAPEVGILVTGQSTGNGINVYQYDKDAQTLELIWAAN